MGCRPLQGCPAPQGRGGRPPAPACPGEGQGGGQPQHTRISGGSVHISGNSVHTSESSVHVSGSSDHISGSGVHISGSSVHTSGSSVHIRQKAACARALKRRDQDSARGRPLQEGHVRQRVLDEYRRVQQFVLGTSYMYIIAIPSGSPAALVQATDCSFE